MEKEMKQAVHFGAGNIGRGFIGDLLHDSGYEVTFVDIFQEMIDQINENGSYDLYLLDHEYQKKTIDHVRAISSVTQEAEVIRAICNADVVTTSVWVNNLPKIAPVLSKGLKMRYQENQPKINVMACENAMFGTDILKHAILEADDELTEELLDNLAAFPNTAVDRVVIGEKKDGKDIVNIADYHELAIEETKLVNPQEKPIANARYTDNLQKFLERKLYVINCGHAYAGYAGYIYGYDSVYDVFMNPDMVKGIREAMTESAMLISEIYDFTKEEMMDYVEFGIQRYQTKGVDYAVNMVTRSPIRKLGASDRMVGPCLLCEERGMKHEALLRGIAMILLLDRTDDTEAVELQDYIKKYGVEEAIEHYTTIQKGTPMQAEILKYYEELKAVREKKRK